MQLWRGGLLAAYHWHASQRRRRHVRVWFHLPAVGIQWFPVAPTPTRPTHSHPLTPTHTLCATTASTCLPACQQTLEGFINQIFDKALTETTFAEMYANLCK